jgi:flagellar biosynthetic protein FliP
MPLILPALLAIGLAANPAMAQDMTISLDENGLAIRSVQLLLLLTVLSLAPALAITVTCFPFLVTVLSILRQAIGLQAAPPNMLIVSLALFLTYFVMEPVFADAWSAGVLPMTEGILSPTEAFPKALAPFEAFMSARVDGDTLDHLHGLRPDAATGSISVLMPAFLISEVSRAFEIGFLIFMPFLIIDMVVSAILMSMGMMMVPPAIVALPFKLAFFVVVDGWALVASALVRGYA